MSLIIGTESDFSQEIYTEETAAAAVVAAEEKRAERRAAAQTLRAIPSEARAQASRENGKKGGRPKGKKEATR